ncbi:hypothetical protein B296_00011047 [Ensete ventricosum]|uniref:Uncharacterized protein n=1 Tax=Ensete ventricosum TaxID=4639 RepID=A0A427AFT3_ENSVE|nr:hypothetical protein B296_00011047 [Ensete ventricosum]
MGRASSYKPPCGVTVGVEPAIEEDQNGQSNGGNGRIHERYVRPVTRIKIMEVLLTKKKAQLLVPVWRKASVLRCVQPILSVSLFPGHLWLIGAREAFFVRNPIHGDERGHGLPVPRKSPNPMERRSTAPFQAQSLSLLLLVQIVRNRVCELRPKDLCPGDQDFGGDWGASHGLPAFPSWQSLCSEAEIYLFGGCITSWKVSNGKDLLFVRPDAVFNGKKPISGGIPHCFPQFGPGPIQQV